MNKLPSLAVGILTQGNLTIGAVTTYTITYITINPMAAGASFIIVYPYAVGVPSAFTTCSVTYSGTAYPMYCVVNSGAHTIQLLNGLNSVAVPSGSHLVITLSPLTNPTVPHSVASFSVTSFTDYT